MEKKKSHNIEPREIKIEIDSEIITVPKTAENIRWEDDGGHIPEVIKMIDNSLLPLRPGDSFKVKSGELIKEKDRVFYVAKIETINE